MIFQNWSDHSSIWNLLFIQLTSIELCFPVYYLFTYLFSYFTVTTPFFLELYMWKFFETYVAIKSSLVLVFVRYFEYPCLETSLCNIPPLKFSERKPNILTTKPSMWERACGFTFLGRVFFFFFPSIQHEGRNKQVS